MEPNKYSRNGNIDLMGRTVFLRAVVEKYTSSMNLIKLGKGEQVSMKLSIITLLSNLPSFFSLSPPSSFPYHSPASRLSKPM